MLQINISIICDNFLMLYLITTQESCVVTIIENSKNILIFIIKRQI